MGASADEARVKELILDRFSQRHKLGEAAGGSGHLGFISVTRIHVWEPREVEAGGQRATEFPFTVETYTETEFLHEPDDDVYYTNRYGGTIVLDGSMNVLDFKCD